MGPTFKQMGNNFRDFCAGILEAFHPPKEFFLFSSLNNNHSINT